MRWVASTEGLHHGRRLAVMLRSLLTIMMSPATRALWLCESGSSREICDTTRGFFGSRTSRIEEPSRCLFGMWPT